MYLLSPLRAAGYCVRLCCWCCSKRRALLLRKLLGLLVSASRFFSVEGGHRLRECCVKSCNNVLVFCPRTLTPITISYLCETAFSSCKGFAIDTSFPMTWVHYILVKSALLSHQIVSYLALLSLALITSTDLSRSLVSRSFGRRHLALLLRLRCKSIHNTEYVLLANPDLWYMVI